MKRSIAVAVGLSVVLGLAACSSSGDATRDVEIAQQKQIDGLQERVTSLESRVAWLEVVGRKAIQANPTAYEEQLAADMASLEAQWNTARASADAVAAQVTEQKAAAEKAITDARAAVDAAKAAEAAEDAARTDAIEAAEQRLAEAKVALEELKQRIQDALASASATASPTAS